MSLLMIDRVMTSGRSDQSVSMYMNPHEGLTGPDNKNILVEGPADGHRPEDRSGDPGNFKNKNFDTYECQTCKNRKYQDGSDDPGVSFKTPTAISPEKAASAVRAHEQEHVSREQAAASREGREVVSQSVSYQTGICPECGKAYIAGGTTRTVTKKEVDEAYSPSQKELGKNMDTVA